MNPPELSFCMIVRDGAATLADCLSSVAPLVDELVVVDTGSRDDTVAIARRSGAHLTSAPWKGDFAAARNRYLQLARGRWILSLDADEWLPSFNLDTIRSTVAANPCAAFGVTVRNFFHHDLEWPRFLAPSEFGGRATDELSWHVSRTIRLFPRLPGLSYRYPVHESLIPAARTLGVRLRMSDVVIHHRQHSPAGAGRSAAKTSLYRTLAEDKVERYPGYQRGHLEMARIYLDGGSWDRAESHLRQCLRLSPLTLSATYCLGELLVQTGRWRDLKRHLATAPMQRIDRRYLEGRRLLGTGRPDQAAELLAAVLVEKPGYRPASSALGQAAGDQAVRGRAHRRRPRPVSTPGSRSRR